MAYETKVILTMIAEAIARAKNIKEAASTQPFTRNNFYLAHSLLDLISFIICPKTCSRCIDVS